MAGDRPRHRWRFHRVGGFDQVELNTGEDLLALGELDQKLWVALACPIDGIELDRTTLELIDTDKDGRIRAPELIAAVEWAGSVLKDAGSLLEGSAELPLSALNDSEEGRRLAASAKRILKNLGKKGADAISADDTADTRRIFYKTRFNGDGVVPPASADSEDVRRAIEEIMVVTGAEKDRSGEDGVNQEKVDRFFAEAEAFSAWWREAEGDAANVQPLGDATAAAADAFRAVEPKLDDYFTRVRLASFDERAGAPLNRDPAEYAALSPKLLTEKLEEIAAFPIARVEPKRALPLEGGVNPAWAAALKKLRAAVVTPLLGERSALTEDEWSGLSARFAAYEAWRAAKAGASVEKLGLARVRALLSGGYKDKICDLIEKDRALEPEVEAIASVDRLVRYHRDLYQLLNNFVTFRDFYAKKSAMFQVGTLYLDARSCDLCVKVADAAAHSAVATLSGNYLVYCDLARKGSGEKMTIAAAVTNGDSDNLMVGRNGIFYDRRGHDWDAMIVKIVEHPISIRQAFWAPYKWIAKLLEEQVEKFAASRDKEVHDKAAANIEEKSKAAEAPAPADKTATPFDIAKFAGIFAAIGIAVGMIGAALAAAATGFFNLAWWQMPLVVAGLLLLISGPSMLIAYAKLRRRNLGPLLDATGWAVNAKAKINVPFGASLTQLAVLPPGAERSIKDPYEEKRRPWWLYAILLALLAAGVYFWRTGQLQSWLKELQAPHPAASAVPSGDPAAPPAK